MGKKCHAARRRLQEGNAMLKNSHIWLSSYILKSAERFLRRRSFQKPIHIMFAVTDHFEPFWHGASPEVSMRRVSRWVREYPGIAGKFKDSDGVHPQHTFFYPEEEYRSELMVELAKLCSEGFGEIEIHLHHDNDTSEALRNKLEHFKDKLVGHGQLSKDREGKIRYGFIHGNWALDNSRKDGRLCGVNNELEILRDTGCYADFTLPSAPSDTQTRKINSIYYAKDDPIKSKSHNSGIDVEVDRAPSGDLMIVQGPLGLNWKRRKRNIFPRIENGEISYRNKPFEDRIDLWVKANIHVEGRPEWVFVKVHTHGTIEENSDILLGKPFEFMHTYLQDRYNDKKKYFLHYVTAREMFNIIKAAEQGMNGNPAEYRDYILNKG